MVVDSLEQHLSKAGCTNAVKQSSPSAADNSTCRPRKKGGRSQSPRAMERRRLQNRIAQRNHRRRMKERTAAGNMDDIQEPQTTSISQPASSDNSNKTNTHNTSSQPFSSSSSSSSHTMDTTFLTDDLHKSSMSLGFDPMMPQVTEGEALSSIPGLDLFPMSSSCTCNVVTGPCAGHLEEIRSQVLRSPMATPNSQSMPRLRATPGSSYQDASNQPAQYMESSPISVDLTSSHDSRSHQLAPSTASRSSSSSARSIPSPGISNRESSKRSRAARSPSSGSTVSNAVVQNTARFKTILDVVRSAGFADFDRMAAAYYTAQFEKDSLPDITQRASRGWRLNKLLQELHESSRNWSPWESRGLREGVIESATMECIDEIDRIANGHFQGCNSDSSSESMDIKGNVSDSSTGVGSLACLPTLPDMVDSAVQDTAPYLWGLVTELAGPESIHCNRVSNAVLSLLADARRSQYS
ncbi:hypothetical protein BDV25DRAFT_107033 [Aspergillus avenaceus]|uniref:BZIP domain-containing protein n=1 Tax=Aspergillus avenaceus TaxID=36643 RepID=A0A5N6TWF6_ASPAV|nr:hypothetical protein BDV25DRAFT_107033 [Aspergillus avenaceus]